MRGAIWFLLLAACKIENGPTSIKQNDDWRQEPNNEVDILWVVDASASMVEEQASLADGFSSFIQQIDQTGTDFHIGLITTSFEYTNSARGTLIGDPAVITNADNYVQLFQERALVGTNGSDKEKGLEAASYALSPVMATGPNAGFIRSDATLVEIIVSDEEDCSDEGALEGYPAEDCYYKDDLLVPISDYVQDFRELKSKRDLVHINSIVGPLDNSCPDAFPGERYVQVSALTGGLVGSICESDWSNMLADMGLEASGIRTSFQLSCGAVPETLIVSVDENGGEDFVEVPVSETDGYTYDAESLYITFHGNSVPPRGSAIFAEYEAIPGTCTN